MTGKREVDSVAHDHCGFEALYCAFTYVTLVSSYSYNSRKCANDVQIPLKCLKHFQCFSVKGFHEV